MRGENSLCGREARENRLCVGDGILSREEGRPRGASAGSRLVMVLGLLTLGPGVDLGLGLRKSAGDAGS